MKNISWRGVNMVIKYVRFSDGYGWIGRLSKDDRLRIGNPLLCTGKTEYDIEMQFRRKVNAAYTLDMI